MNVLFDQGVPVPLRPHLHPHSVDTTAEKGWSTLQNGELLDKVQSGGYEVFITTDCNLRHQQNLSRWKLRILVLTTTSWPKISKKVVEIREALEQLDEGDYTEVEI